MSAPAVAGVDERADLRAEREVVGAAVDLDHVRAVGGQAADDIEVAVRVPQQLVEVPGAVDVAAGARDAAALLLVVALLTPVVGVADLVRRGQAGVVAVETAVGSLALKKVRRQRPAELEGVGTGGSASAWRIARVARDRRDRAWPRPPAITDLVALGVERAEVLDGHRSRSLWM
ncbi:MAG: hypothetical protein R2708_25035 [Vicinamibacterales bacterium]